MPFAILNFVAEEYVDRISWPTKVPLESYTFKENYIVFVKYILSGNKVSWMWVYTLMVYKPGVIGVLCYIRNNLNNHSKQNQSVSNKKYKLFDETKFISVPPTSLLIEQSISRTISWMKGLNFVLKLLLLILLPHFILWIKHYLLIDT